MRKVLKRNFFNRPTIAVARSLLGKFLVRKIGRRTIDGMITEVEAYDGLRDKASHASRGETPRCRVMFGPAGAWYVYLTYGMHWMLNVVTGENGYPAAVLIRSAGSARGPGRLTKRFGVDKRFHCKLLRKGAGLWVEDRGVKIKKSRIKKGKRIGVEYAGAWKNKLWRFYI